MTTYTLVGAIHVIFVVSFLAAAGSFGVIGPMAKAQPQHATFALQVEQKVYEVLVFPGLLIVWVTGLYQTFDGDFVVGDLWLTISVVLFALMTVAMLFVLYPGIKTALSELEAQTEPGPPSANAQSALKKLGAIGPLTGIAMVVITFLMVAQPF